MQDKQNSPCVQIVLFILFVFTFQVNAQTYVPGTSYFDDNGYVEYIAGNLPIIISAPHGGGLLPAEIPDRDCSGCVYTRDSYTKGITLDIQTAFFEATGYYPHVVINLLHRRKFDANRDITTAADGNATVEESWYAYHDFIDDAKATIEQEYGQGLFIDVHGQTHDIYRIEFGYGLTRSQLQLPDADLNTATYLAKSSIKNLATNNIQNLTHAELLRGLQSIGALVENEGFPAVPSYNTPFPAGQEDYFSGGYNTIRHGSRDGGVIDGIQMEMDSLLRFTALSREEFAIDFAAVAMDYLEAHYIRCDVPSAITTNVVSGNCVYVEFGELDEARKYKLWYREKGVGASWIERLPKASRFFLNDLTPNTNYELKMKSLCAGPFASEWSSVSDFNTASTLCDRPATMMASNITASGATISWVDQIDDDKYKINYRQQGSPTWITTTTNNIDYIFTGLQADTKYYYKVKTKCPSGLWTNWPSKQFFNTATSLNEIPNGRLALNNKATTFRLYPNPTASILNVDVNGMNVDQIRLSDINGKVLQYINTSDAAETIDISMLKDGVYSINVITKTEGVISKKFVKMSNLN